MEEKTIELLKTLTETPGSPVLKPYQEGVKRIPCSLVNRTDYRSIGSLVAVKRGTDEHPRVMVAAHMDEVGFLITRVTDDGFIKFQPLGGWWNRCSSPSGWRSLPAAAGLSG